MHFISNSSNTIKYLGIFIIFFIMSIFTSFSNANFFDDSHLKMTIKSPDTCESKEVLLALQHLNIYGKKGRNGALKEEIKRVYGETMWRSLKAQHPSLRNKNGNLDARTLEWVTDELFSTSNKRNLPVLFIPFSTPNEDTFIAVIGHIISSSIKGHMRTNVIFINEDMRISFWEYFKKLEAEGIPGGGDFKEYFINTYIDFMKEKPPIVNNDILRIFADKLYKSFKAKEHVLVGSSETDRYSVVMVWGHGLAGDDKIYDNNGNSLTAREVVSRLNQNGLLGENTRVKMLSCFSACSIAGHLVPFTPEETVKMFRSGALQNFMKDQSSWLHLIHNEVRKQKPGHQGTVEGYLGIMNRLPDKTVLHMDGSVKLSNFVEIKAGQETLKLSASEMRIVLHSNR